MIDSVHLNRLALSDTPTATSLVTLKNACQYWSIVCSWPDHLCRGQLVSSVDTTRIHGSDKCKLPRGDWEVD